METEKYRQELEGRKLSPLMNQLASGATNPHPELTVMKPADQRDSIGATHPAEVVDLSSEINYYNYPWTTNARSMSAMNYTMLSIFAVIIAASIYLLAGTKLLKFIQFFLTKQQYKKLQIKITDQPLEQEPQQTDQSIIYQTPRPTTDRPPQARMAQLEPRRDTGLASNLGYHGRTLVQFFAPVLALYQMATCSSALVVPGYVLGAQICFRAAIILTLTVVFSLFYMSVSFSEQVGSCVMSRDTQSTSYYCLNEYDPASISASNHQGALILIGTISAVLGAAAMFGVSKSVFINFKAYLGMVAEESTSTNSRFVNKMRITSSGHVEAKSRQKSPKKKDSPLKKHRDSVTSFRNILDRDSDSSMLPFPTDQDQGYDSAAQMSMSTQANALNLSERGGLLNQSVGSARETQAGKKYPQAGNVLDLMPIDEDVDDEQCSPIKPKRRTKEDSPFKRHQNSNSEISSVNQQSVGAFKMDLKDKDQLSLHLDSVLDTPSNKQKENEVKKSFEPIIDASLSESGFHIEVEKVADKKEPGLKTVNSGPSNKQTETSIMNQPTYAVSNSRNQPSSLNVCSFGGNSESTLQLDTIAPVKANLGSSAQAPDGSKDEHILSDYQEKQGANYPQPLSTRNARQSVGISLITPFGAKIDTCASGNEVQTEDKNSVGITYNRNLEVLDSSGVSNKDSMRPNSGPRKGKRRNIKSNELLKEFKIEQERLSRQTDETTHFVGKVKTALFVVFVMAFIFGLCIDAYFLHSLPTEGLSFIAVGLVAAIVADLLVQCLFILLLAAVQFGYELRGRELPLDTHTFLRLSNQRKELAMVIFSSHKEQSALLKVDFQDEEDLLLESLAAADIEKQSESSSCVSGPRVGARDILTKDTRIELQFQGLDVQVTETLRFRPPRAPVKRSINVGMVQPRVSIEMIEQANQQQVGLVSSFVDILGEGADQQEEQVSKKRRPEISKFERTHKFFADQMPIQKKRLRSSHKESPTKKSASMLRQSIEQIELDNLEGDFPKEGPSAYKRGRSQTPEKLQAEEGVKSTLLYSSNKKISKFETPKGQGQLSHVKLRHGSIESGTRESNHDSKAQVNNDSEVRRKLVMPKASIVQMGGSMEDVRKVSSQKKYLEDGEGNGLVGMLHSNSSKSGLEGIEAGKGTLDNERYVSQEEKEQFNYNSQDNEAKGDNQDVYSPNFDSHGRKPTKTVDPIQQKSKKQDATSFSGLSMAKIETQVEKGIYTRNPTCSNDLNAAQSNSSNSRLVATILSHREALSKQQSFNSPKSLHDQLQLTNDKINNSIEGSSIHKGRRKMMMLDEAGLSKQSLQFGQAQNTSSIVNGSSLIGIPFNNSGSICCNNSSGSVTPVGGKSQFTEAAEKARHNSAVVLFEDQGEPDYQREHQIETDGVEVEQPIMLVSQKLYTDDDYSNTDVAALQHQTGTNEQSLGTEERSNNLSTIEQAKIKRSSIHSQMAAPKDAERTSNLQGSQTKADPAADSKSQTNTTAFQRLVQASKRIMAKKSSEKKDPIQSKLEPYAQMRSQSQTGADTMSIMKDQTNNAAVFQQPFQVTKKNYRSSSDPQTALQRKVGANKKVVNEAKQAHEAALDNVFKHYKGLSLEDQRQKQISVIKEASVEPADTPINQPRISRDIKKEVSGSSMREQGVPDSFIKEQVNPVKPPITPKTEERQAQLRSKGRQSHKNGVVGDHLTSAATSQALKQFENGKIGARNVRSRKNSQLSSKTGNEKKGPQQSKKGSKNSTSNYPFGKEKRSFTEISGRGDHTMSSALSLDFEKMDKLREDDYSDFSKMISTQSNHNRLEDQRRRLESFLSLAQQAKSKRDIAKIQDMIRQIDDTQRPLPMSRINELKLLELMASPYNQSLIAMIQVELDIARKVREFKRLQQQSNQNSKSKFSLPKHLQSGQNSKINVSDLDNSQKHGGGKRQDSIGGGIRLTTVVNIKSKGITSCRSNNDVANRRFNRSPSHLNASPMSMGACQPVLSGNNRRDNSVGKRDSSVGRYSYLRNVGNTVVNQDVRKSVDRIRLSKDGVEQIARSGTDLMSGLKTKFEEEGRRGTTPVEVQQKSGFFNQKPGNIMMTESSGGQNSQAELFAGRNEMLAQNRSKTSNGVQKVEGVGPIKQGFIKRITQQDIEKSVQDEKENQQQSRAHI